MSKQLIGVLILLLLIVILLVTLAIKLCKKAQPPLSDFNTHRHKMFSCILQTLRSSDQFLPLSELAEKKVLTLSDMELYIACHL